MAALDRSYNSDSTLRQEHGGYIYQTKTGAYIAIPDPGVGSSDCYFLPTIPPPKYIVGSDTLRAISQYHTHASPAPSMAQGCLQSDGTPYGTWVQIDNSTNGGGSDPDWTMTGGGLISTSSPIMEKCFG